jgi:tetratricopeptide (TPR) repeat protein
MMAEGQGRADEARDLFAQAWAASTDDFDRCVAANYLARHQGSPEQTLHWNREVLTRADAVEDDRVRGFYPLLYLNLRRSYEDLGDRNKARRYYEHSAARIGDLPADVYGAMMQRGVGAGRWRCDVAAEDSQSK